MKPPEGREYREGLGFFPIWSHLIYRAFIRSFIHAVVVPSSHTLWLLVIIIPDRMVHQETWTSVR